MLIVTILIRMGFVGVKLNRILNHIESAMFISSSHACIGEEMNIQKTHENPDRQPHCDKPALSSFQRDATADTVRWFAFIRMLASRIFPNPIFCRFGNLSRYHVTPFRSSVSSGLVQATVTRFTSSLLDDTADNVASIPVRLSVGHSTRSARTAKQYI
jgi:hypothetical protein